MPGRYHDPWRQEVIELLRAGNDLLRCIHEAVLLIHRDLNPDATAFQITPYTQPISGDHPMIDPTTLVPLQPGTPVPSGSRVVFGVTNDPPGSRISGLTATSTTEPQPVVDSTDQQTNYVLCDPIADQTQDSVITFGDPDGSPTGTATIDWNAGTVTDATGFVINAFTQPITVPVPTAARFRGR